MATIKPFAALRPKPELAARICELPYDVMSSQEAREMAEGNPLSFLHVSKPEIDLPPATDVFAPEVYAKGKENFERLIAQGALRKDSAPCFYLYRQIMGNHAQTGLVAAASCQEYLDGIVKKHELTRPDKEDDRVRHIESLNAQTGPVFLTYRAVSKLDEFVAKKTTENPDVDFTAKDGVRHTSWVISDPAEIQLIESEFARIPFLYIADGHHRSAAAARVYSKRKTMDLHPLSRPSDTLSPALSGGEGRGEEATEGTGKNSTSFLSVIFPHNQMQILPYNRVLKDLNGLSPVQLMEKLDGVFVTLAAPPAIARYLGPEHQSVLSEGVSVAKVPGNAGPTRKHRLGLYLQGQWHTLNFRPRFAATTDPIEKLDVTLLQKYVLDPIFGIADPRTSKRINFVGGIRGAAELEKLVNSGEYACAFSMFPTSIEDLMSIADAGGIMPPKSTWFEPKLRDAMFCHLI